MKKVIPFLMIKMLHTNFKECSYCTVDSCLTEYCKKKHKQSRPKNSCLNCRLFQKKVKTAIFRLNNLMFLQPVNTTTPPRTVDQGGRSSHNKGGISVITRWAKQS